MKLPKQIRRLQLLQLAMGPQTTLSQASMLLLIAEKPNITASELAKEVGLTLAAVSRFVAVMSKGRKGAKTPGRRLVIAKQDPDDDRVKLLQLTEHGKAVLAVLQEVKAA